VSENVVYRDPQRSVEERVEDLLSRMTLEEKVGQMCQVNGNEEPKKWLRQHHIGSFLHVLGQMTNDLQRLAEHSRLGIPLVFGIDAIHGHAFWPTATVFPTQLGMSCTWNPELIREIGRVTALEASLTGVHWTFSPVLGTARDLRWGRIDETFGEDPYLIGVLGSALVRGYQGDDLSDSGTILACAKHYAGYPGTQGGRDSSEADLTERNLRALFLRPFRDAVEAGCATVMAAYHSIDGTPCSASRWLLRDVLRDEWGFEGFVVTDWNNIGRMHQEQMVSATIEEAVQRAVEAGNDMAMSTPEFPDAAVKLVESNSLDVQILDEAVKNILRLKFKLGLFDENRYADLEKGKEIIGCEEHCQVALESAYQSIVLLKNQDHLLPLNVDGSDLKRIAVIGPNADDLVAQLGDWVSWSGQLGNAARERSRETVVTVLDGIRGRVGAIWDVDYCRGSDVLDPSIENVAEAAELARQADVAIVVVGDNLALTGERRDRANLDLSGGQQRLLEAIYETGTPMVVVLINGKPLSIPWIAEHAHAILEAWNPGLEGGTAVAGILFGDRNPSGKLTISFPYQVGQQPVYYNQIPGWHADHYADMPKGPLFAFGYGLSYTSFVYSNLRIPSDHLVQGEGLRVDVDVTNTGERAGTEIVQLYINDVYSSVTTPVKELKGFERVNLGPGETKTVRLEVPYEYLALVNRDLETVVEPGVFEVMVGGSSRDQDLLRGRFEVSAP
jgi:beta-glucosidase